MWRASKPLSRLQPDLAPANMHQARRTRGSLEMTRPRGYGDYVHQLNEEGGFPEHSMYCTVPQDELPRPCRILDDLGMRSAFPRTHRTVRNSSFRKDFHWSRASSNVRAIWATRAI